MTPISCEPIVNCTYGWGRKCRLFQHVMVLDGRSYLLEDLRKLETRYQRFFGITSARLVLHFVEKTILLRGIVDIVAVQQIEMYLRECLSSPLPVSEELGVPVSEPGIMLDDESLSSLTLKEEREALFWEYDGLGLSAEQASALTEEQPALTAEILTEELPVSSAAEPSRWKRQRELLERRRLRLRRLREERVGREHGFDVLALALRLRTELLPFVDVPVNLLAGEVAHYRSEATLCGEPLSGPAGRYRNRYRIKDQGMLVLTNKRMIYLGRQRQIILSYERLREVTHTRRSISFLGDNWSRPQLFEVHRPLEVTMYLEAILQRYARPLPTVQRRTSQRLAPIHPASVRSPLYADQEVGSVRP